MSTRTEAQIRAEKKNDEKRKSAPRLPGSRMTEEQGQLMDRLYDKYGGNKLKAIISAAEFDLNNS